MCVVLRGRKFHYRFVMRGKEYSGPCCVQAVPEGASPKEIEALKKEAKKFEDAEKEKVSQFLHKMDETEKEVRMNKSVTALIENYKFELSGGRPISFTEAFALAVAKPAKRKAASSYAALRETYWNDFSAFMAESFPEVRDLSAVRRAHCEAYVSYLIDNGRFVKEVKYRLDNPNTKRKRPKDISYTPSYQLSPKTIKEIVGVCKWVFSKLEEDAGITRDPWKDVVLPAGESVDREVFSRDELSLIWNGMQGDPFIYHLFIIAANSGMTEGDICTLKWSDIDWSAPGGGAIRRRRRKTGAHIELPMMPQLRDYLARLPRVGEYVSPYHAEMYLRQQSCVSSRVKAFLNGLGIVTTVQVEGRRARSVKDLHSMRHVFCYRAKRAKIPESVIMKFVGHEVLAMTQHYADHDTMEDLAEEMRKLPALFAGELSCGTDPRKELADLAYTLPQAQVEELLEYLRVRSLPERVCS